MDIQYDVRACQVQLVGIACLTQHPSYHGTHSTIQYQYALLNDIPHRRSFYLFHHTSYLFLFVNLHGAVHFASVFFLFQRLALVKLLLTLTERQVHLGTPFLVDEYQ